MIRVPLCDIIYMEETWRFAMFYLFFKDIQEELAMAREEETQRKGVGILFGLVLQFITLPVRLVRFIILSLPVTIKVTLALALLLVYASLFLSIFLVVVEDLYESTDGMLGFNVQDTVIKPLNRTYNSFIWVKPYCKKCYGISRIEIIECGLKKKVTPKSTAKAKCATKVLDPEFGGGKNSQNDSARRSSETASVERIVLGPEFGGGKNSQNDSTQGSSETASVERIVLGPEFGGEKNSQNDSARRSSETASVERVVLGPEFGGEKNSKNDSTRRSSETASVERVVLDPEFGGEKNSQNDSARRSSETASVERVVLDPEFGGFMGPLQEVSLESDIEGNKTSIITEGVEVKKIKYKKGKLKYKRRKSR